MDIISEIDSKKFKNDKEKSRMMNEKEIAENAIEDIVTSVTNNILNLMTFGFELRKADEEFKYSKEILEKGSTQKALNDIFLK